MHPRKACRHHRASRGAAANDAATCSRRRTVCPLIFKQLVGSQAPVSRLAYICAKRAAPPWCETCHPCTSTRPAAIKAKGEELPQTLPLRAPAGAQFVHSFSSSWSADKPQCRG